MKNTRMLLILVLAIACGLAAGYSALRYLSDRPTPIVATGTDETVPVVLAARDLRLGKVLEEDDLRTVEWPAAALPTGFASATEEVMGQSLIADVQVNEPILSSKLEGDLRGLIPLIEEGKRALAIRVNEVIGVAGFVTPNTFVDIILIMTPPGSSETQAKTILQNIKALSANQTIQESEDGTPIISAVVTVLVTPEEAERLTLADAEGDIQLMLRHTLDLEPVETTGERTSRLFRGGGMGPVGTPVRNRRTASSTEESIIEVYRGGVKSQTISYTRPSVRPDTTFGPSRNDF